MTMAKILTPKHPDHKKVEQWFNLGMELGIKVSFFGCRTRITVGNSEMYDLEEIENQTPISECPPNFDYKIVKGRE